MLLLKHNLSRLLVLLCVFPIYSLAACSLPSGLVSWTSTYGTGPISSDIIISVPILVDSTNIVAQGITLNSGGSLFFDSTKPSITLSANFILINSGGGLYIGSESCPYTSIASIVLTGQGNVNAVFGGNFIGVALGGTLELHGAKGISKSWTKLIKTAPAGSTSIQVLDTLNWQVGDQVVIASTDFSPLQSEVVTITSLVGGTGVSFTPALKWDHFGLWTQNVDERAEVGMLTRNIRISGYQRGTYYGGHLMVVSGFLQFHVEGVEFSNMGQDEIGKYPIHFHMCGVVPKGTYARYNSIHDSNFRCVTIHGSHGVLIEGNVAYKHYGHCYFLEDGIEVDNIIRGNLAVLTQPKDFGQRIGSDASNTGLSSYWISNPQNTIQDNVAAGSYTAGFWIITRLGATGSSACLPQYQNIPLVSNLPLQSFSGNSAHSCTFGLGIESTNWDAGDIPVKTCSTSVANWEPRNPDNSIPFTYFENFTAHHIRDRGLWARMPNIVAKNSRFADNYESIEYATSGDMPPYASQQIVQSCIVVGFSDNKGNQEPTPTWQTWDIRLKQSVPSQGNTPTNGIKIYDGPQVIIDSVFVNFPTVPGRPLDSAIGARLADQSQVATTNYLKNVQFINVGARFAVVDEVMDGGITGNFRDTDGSVTGFTSATVLRNLPFYRTSGCVASDAYMLVCPHRYAQLWVMDMTSNGAGNSMIITRTNYPASESSLSHSLTFVGFLSGPSYRYQPIVSLGTSYLIRFLKVVPPSLVLQLNNAEQNDYVSVAICYPLGAVISSVQRGLANYYGNPFPIIQPQSSVTSIAASGSLSNTGDSYTFDTANAILYLRLQQRNARTDYGNFCPDSGCDWLWIKAQYTASAAARDCTAAFAASSAVQSLSALTTSWLSQALTAAPPLSSVLDKLVGGSSTNNPVAPVAATPAPAATVPAATVPAATVPAATVPAATVPAPAATVPAAAVPAGTTVPTTRPVSAPIAPTTKPSAIAAATAAAAAAATKPPAAAATKPAATVPRAAPAAVASLAPVAPVTSSCAVVCPVGMACCGVSCYPPAVYQCFGTKLCTLGLLPCSNDCYIPGKYACNNGILAPML